MHRADLERVVVEEADRLEPEVGPVRDLARDDHAGLARADQQHAMPGALGRPLLATLQLAAQPAARADADQPHERQDEVHGEHAEREQARRSAEETEGTA